MIVAVDKPTYSQRKKVTIRSRCRILDAMALDVTVFVQVLGNISVVARIAEGGNSCGGPDEVSLMRWWELQRWWKPAPRVSSRHVVVLA